MAKNILDQKVGEFNLIDGGIIALSKVGTEEVLGNISYVGNGTIRSGLIKLGTAVFGSMLTKNKYVQYVASGLLIDGFEDLIYSMKNKNNVVKNTSEVIL